MLALVGDDPADVVGVLPDQVGVEVVRAPARISSACSWSTQKTIVLAKRSVLLEEVGQVPGDGLGAGLQRDDPLEVGRLVLLVGNLPAVAVDVALAGPPAGRVPLW